MTELKRCPFCGGKATIIEQDPPEMMKAFWGDKAPKKVMTVGCNTQGCILFHCKGNSRLFFVPEGKEVLIERWNHRIEDFSNEECCYNCKHYDRMSDYVCECANEESEYYEENINPWDTCDEWEEVKLI